MVEEKVDIAGESEVKVGRGWRKVVGRKKSGKSYFSAMELTSYFSLVNRLMEKPGFSDDNAMTT